MTVNNSWLSGPLQRVRARMVTISVVAAIAIASLLSERGASAAELDLSIASVDNQSGLTVVVAGSDDGVNLRSEPGIEGEVLDTLPDGTVVTLRIDTTDTVVDDAGRWWPVVAGGVEGWIIGEFLAESGAAPTDVAADDLAVDPTADGPSFSVGDRVAVETDTGDGLSMRSGPSTDFERLAGLGEGDVVQIEDGPFADGDGAAWYLVNDGGFSAYVAGGYLVLESLAVGDLPESSADFAVGDRVAPAAGTDGVNVRSQPSVDSGRLGAVGEGFSVQVTDGPFYDDAGDAWYQVSFAGDTGYMFSGLLTDGSDVAPFRIGGPTGTFIYPLQEYIFTQAYGCSGLALEPWNASLGCPYHNGIDLAAPSYTPLLAADGGEVIVSGWCDCGLGFYVEIDHGNGYSTIYGHMAEQPWVAVGDEVDQGDVIGPVGSTGLSTGPHVRRWIPWGCSRKLSSPAVCLDRDTRASVTQKRERTRTDAE
jgi:uncharacterized protein YgiM (DUF1202 family)